MRTRKLELPMLFYEADGAFVVYIPDLDLHTGGSTLEEAKRLGREVASIFIEELYGMGTAEDVLEDLGWGFSFAGNPGQGGRRTKVAVPPKFIEATVETVGIRA